MFCLLKNKNGCRFLSMVVSLSLLAGAKSFTLAKKSIALRSASAVNDKRHKSSQRRDYGVLFMGKGLNSARNKQAELLKKMQLAKKEKQQNPTAQDDDKEEELSSSTTKTEDSDHAEFAKLLASEKKNLPRREYYKESSVARFEGNKKSFTKVKSTINSVSSSFNTKTSSNNNNNNPLPKVRSKNLKRQKKKLLKNNNGNNADITDLTEEAQKTTLQEGDSARRNDFEKVISLETSCTLGPIGAAGLVPWVPPYLNDYLVVLADPRTQSSDLRQSMQYLTSNVSSKILSNVMVITKDSIGETKKWMSRADLKETPIQVFSDDRLEWMRTYSAVVHDERWSMSVFIFCARGIIQRHVRQVNPSMVSELVMDMIQSIKQEE